MTIKEFISCIVSSFYIDNPELSEVLYKFKKQVWKDILAEEKNVPENTSHNKDMWCVASYAVNNGLGDEEFKHLISILADNGLWDRIRREFDEEYVEYGFLSIEDGGRGEHL